MTKELITKIKEMAEYAEEQGHVVSGPRDIYEFLKKIYDKRS